VRLREDNPARLPWFLLGISLVAWTLGQAALTFYQVVLARTTPLPSVADIGFVLGSLLMLVAVFRFIGVYRSSGFPVGSVREHLLLAGGTTAALAAVAYPLLAPIIRAHVPLGERFINVAYPVLDFAALVLTLVMIRIADAFRPGKVWAVWAALLTGFVFTAVGDILFAYMSSIGETALLPAVDVAFLLGYFFAACGTKLQHELLTE
jgi:hypothetical protein